MLGIEHDEIGTKAGCQAADRPARRLGPAQECARPQAGPQCGAAASAATTRRRCAGAGPAPAAAARPRRRWSCCCPSRCRTARPGARNVPSGKIPSPRSASVVGHSPTTACRCATTASSASVRWVPWTRHQSWSISATSRSSCQRPPPEPLQAVADLLGLLGEVDVDRHRHRLRTRRRRPLRRWPPAAPRAPSAARGRPAGWGRRRRRARGWSASRAQPSGSSAKRRCALGQRAAVHARLHVDHRAAASARSRSPVPPRGSPATSPPARRMSCRRADGAGNGTRPPRCSRP